MKTPSSIPSVLAAAFAVIAFPASAATNTWTTSTSDGLWATSSNWTTVPTTTDNIVFGSATTTTISTATRTINNVTFNSGAPSYTINGTSSGQVLSLTGNGVNDNSANAQTFAVGVAQLSGASANTLATLGANNAALTFSGGYNFNSASAQTTTLAFGSTTGGTINLGGNVTNSGGGTGNLTLTQSSSGSGTVILSGANTGLTGTLTLANNVTVKLGSSGALASGATVTNTGNMSLSNIWLASDTAVNGFAVNYASINNPVKNTVTLDRATPGAALTTQTLTSLALGNQSTLTFNKGFNVTSGTPLITVSGATSFGASGSSNAEIINSNGVNVSLGAVSAAAGATSGVNSQLVFDTNTSGNTIAGVISNGTSGGTVANTVSSSSGNTITLSSTPTGFTAGMTISGTGIASGTIISSISGNVLTLSQTPTSPTGTVTGTAISVANFDKSGSGTVTLSAANTYTGVTNINGGTLNLDFSASGAPTSDILYNGYVTSGTGVRPTVTVGGGTLLLTGKANTANTESFGKIQSQVNFPGVGNITLTPGSGTGTLGLTVSSIATSVSSLLNFNIASGSSVTVTGASNGFIGSRVTINGNDFAYINSAKIVTPTTSNYSNGGGTNNALISSNTGSIFSYYYFTGPMARSASIDLGYRGLKITGTGTNDVLDLNGGTLSFQNSQLIYTGGGNGNYTIQNGTLQTSGVSSESMFNVASGTTLNISAAINDNGGLTTSIGSSGPGTLAISGGKSFTGKAYVVGGGTYSFDTIASGGSSSGLGASSNAAANLTIGGVLKYTGSGGSTDRSFTIGGIGATIDASGSGALTWAPASALLFENNSNSGTSSLVSQDQYITFTGSSAAANTFGSSSGLLADPSSLPGLLYVTKSGTGQWVFNGANTYTGTTAINNGTLTINTVGTGTTAQSLGGGTTVTLGVAGTSSGKLNYTGGAGTLDKTIAALGNGSDTIQNSGTGLLTLSGSLIKNGTVLTLNGGSNGINVTGVISGSLANSDLDITGGTTTISTLATYNGPTAVFGGGTLVNGVTGGALPTGTAMTLGSAATGGTFDLNGNNQTIAGLNSSGSALSSVIVTNNGASNATITIAGSGAFGGILKDGSTKTTALTLTSGTQILSGANTNTGATTISGGSLQLGSGGTTGSLSTSSVITDSGNFTVNRSNAVSQGTDFSGSAITGSGSFTQAGTGTTTLTAANSYTGGTTISAGKLFANNNSGSGTGTGTVTVQTGSTLGGKGTVSGAVTVQSGGMLFSGAVQSNAQTSLGGPGVDTITGTGLTLSSNLAVNAGSTLSFNLGAGASTGALNFASPNLNSTYLTANGGVTFGSSSIININLVDLTAFSTTGDTLHLHLEENPYLVIDGLVNSDFNLYTTGGYQQNGWVTGVGAGNLGGFNITMYDINGNDITAAGNFGGLQLYLYNGNLEVVPEPGTWAMMLGGLVLLVVIQRRANKQG